MAEENQVQQQSSTAGYDPVEGVKESHKKDPIEKDIKKDYFLTRLDNAYLTVDNIMGLYTPDEFGQFRTKESYWADNKIKDKFLEAYGFLGRNKFNEMYDLSVQEFSGFQEGNYSRALTGFELYEQDMSKLNSTSTMRFDNIQGTLERGFGWSDPTKDYRENFDTIRIRQEDGTFEFVEYSPELLKALEETDPTFGGLAYSDDFLGIDQRAGVDGMYYDTINDGMIYSTHEDKMVDVRNDQVVSKHDLMTGSIFDGWLQNNKLEAEGIFDYLKILVRAPLNMANNMMDTGVQLLRASIAGGYGIANLLTDEELDVRKDDAYKWLSTVGIRWKSNQTSLSRQAMEGGFFRSLEGSLSTIADIALQVGLARALGAASKAGTTLFTKGLKGRALAQAQRKAAEITVRSTLTAMATKDSYNEAIENGFTPSEASVITGAMAAALWQATRYSNYLLGDWEAKALRNDFKEIISTEMRGFMNKGFKQGAEVLKKGVASTVKKVAKGDVKNGFAARALAFAKRTVEKVYGKTSDLAKTLPSNRFVYGARQEAFEEMTEELYQDGVKHAASAYGVLMNNAYEVGKGRYYSIFDPGYFKDAVERYATSGIAGGFGGVMGASFTGNGKMHSITSTSSLVDIITAGKAGELVDVLSEMKGNGQLGPATLSTEYNADLESFNPIIEGLDQESLADMVFNTYMHDINVVTTFMSRGKFGEAREKLMNDVSARDELNNTSMRKDFIEVMGSLIETHSATGISMNIYTEMDKLSEEDITKELPKLTQKISAGIEAKTKEIDKLKEALNSNKEGTKKDANVLKDTPKTTPKEKDSKDVLESDKSKLERLQAEIELSKDVDNEALISLLNNYRKIRAMANGTAAEYYLLQAETNDDPILGSLQNRSEEYKHLGENPLIDTFLAMRDRAMVEEKNHLSKIKLSRQYEAKLADIKDITKEDVKRIVKLRIEAGHLLNEKALKSITKLYKKGDLKEAQDAFNPTSENFIFKNEVTEKPDDKKMLSNYKKLLNLSKHSEAALNSPGIDHWLLTNHIPQKFYKSLSSNLDGARVPIVETDNGGQDGFVLMDKSGLKSLSTDFINTIRDHEFSEMREGLSRVGEELYILRKEALASERDLLTAFDEKVYNKKDLNTLFKMSNAGVLSNKSIMQAGLGEISTLLTNDITNIITMSDHSVIDEVMKQIEHRDAVSKVLNKFITGKGGGELITMLSEFRKNVLDILDFEYDVDEDPDTTIERHAYKDYSAMSDLFVDFIYDPIKLDSFKQKIAEDRSLVNEGDKEVFDKYRDSVSFIEDTIDVVVEGEDGKRMITNKIVEIDYSLLESELNATYKNLTTNPLFNSAIKQFNKGYIDVSSAVIGEPVIDEQSMVRINLTGITGLKASKWLFRKAKEYMLKAKDGNSSLPYIENKDRNIITQYKTMSNMIMDPNLKALAETVESELYDDNSIKVVTLSEEEIKNLSKDELGALNIKIENILFRIYNGKVPIASPGITLDELKKDIDFYIRESLKKVLSNSDINNRDVVQKEAAVLIGSVSTDFTSYYSKFKALLENSKEGDDIVIADQEHAAKYSSAFIYSKQFRENIKRYTASISSASYMLKNYVESIFIEGSAGSGKTSVTAGLGMKLAHEILVDDGFEESASVLAVSIHKEQIENITASLKGNVPLDPDSLNIDGLVKLLNDAAISNDASAITRLGKLSSIVIDEATYVSAYPKDGKKGLLVKISESIQNYNRSNRVGKNELTLILLGDTKQSGARVIKDGGHVYKASLDNNNAFSVGYMGFSFRNRNTYLSSSIEAIREAEPKRDKSGLSAPYIKLGKGLQYGTLNNRLYGINIIKGTDESNSDFIKLLNSSVDNVRINIEKDIKAIEKDASKGKNFSVIIAPESITEFNEKSSDMHKLIEEYPDYFTKLAVGTIGGSEADYVFAEIPSEPFGEGVKKVGSFFNELHKDLNTIATRAFDFVGIVNKSPDIIIPSESLAHNMGDGNVIIPDSLIDDQAKKDLREKYIVILSNVTPGIIKGSDTLEDDAERDVVDVHKDFSKYANEQIDRFLVSKESLLYEDRVISLHKSLELDGARFVEYLEAASNMLNSDSDIDTFKTDVNDKLTSFYTSLSDSRKEFFIGFTDFLNNIMDSEAGSSDSAKHLASLALENALAKINVANAEFKNSSSEVSIKFLDVEIGNGMLYSDLIDQFKVQLYKKDGISEKALKASISENKTKEEETLVNSVVEDILVEAHAATGTSPDIFNTAGEEYELLNQALHALVIEKALEDGDIELETLPDIAEDSEGFSNYIFELDSLSKEKLAKRIGIVKKALKDESIESIPYFNNVAHLVDSFSRESILKGALFNLENAHDKRVDTSLLDTDMALLDALKRVLEIDVKIVDSKELFAKISALIITGDDSLAKKKGDALSEIKFLWNRVYAKDSKGFNTGMYGKMYMNRNKEGVEVLDDFIAIAESINGKNETYTVPVSILSITDVNRRNSLSRVVTRVMNKEDIEKGVVYTIESPKEAIALFNFNNNGASNAPSKLELRATKAKSGKVNIYVVAVDGINKHIISQFDTSPGSINKSDNKNIKDIIKLVNVKFLDPNVTKDNSSGLLILDIKDLNYDLKELLRVRIGGIIKEDSRASVSELRASGLNIADTSYIITDKKSLDDTSDSGSKVRGKSFALYSWDNSINLENSELVRQLKAGTTLNRNLNLVDTNGSIDSSIGILPLNLNNIPLEKLGEILLGDRMFEVGEYVSKMSLVMQRYFSDYILKYNKNDSEQVKIKGPDGKLIDIKLIITKDVIDQAISMREDLQAYLESVEDLEGLNSRINDSIDKIKDDIEKGGALEVMNSLAATHLYNIVNKDISADSASSVIYKNKDTNAYIFNMNKYLTRKDNTSFLTRLNKIVALTDYAVKPIKIEGDKNTENVGVVDPLYLKHLGEYILSSVSGINPPTFVFKATGIASIKSNLTTTQTKKEEFTLEDIALRDKSALFIKGGFNFDSKSVAEVNIIKVKLQKLLDYKVPNLADIDSMNVNKSIIESTIKGLDHWIATKNALSQKAVNTNAYYYEPFDIDDVTDAEKRFSRALIDRLVANTEIEAHVRVKALDSFRNMEIEDSTTEEIVSTLTKGMSEKNSILIENIVNDCK